MSELEITFLGTGSARPTPRRNCAGVYLQYAGDAVLMDCGEGTQMQLPKAGVKSSRLAAIAITHFHGDHINGLPGFLGTMGLNGHAEELTLVGPRGLDRYLKTLHALQILRPPFPLHLVAHDEPVVYRGAGWELRTCPLDHRIPTSGYLFVEDDLPGRFDVERARALGVTPGPDFGVLQRGGVVRTPAGDEVHPEQVMGPVRRGRRVAYISDTRPSARVVEFVAGADVLIHEATYVDALRTQAWERGHSTSVQAAEVAREAGVGRLLLTHLSSKNPRSREHLDEARAVFAHANVAEDLMTIDVPVPRG
jgi:ribonuclease Z